MFPTVDVGVIDMILESCGGSQDRAIEQLLSITDPHFQPDELAHVRQEEAVSDFAVQVVPPSNLYLSPRSISMQSSPDHCRLKMNSKPGREDGRCHISLE